MLNMRLIQKNTIAAFLSIMLKIAASIVLAYYLTNKKYFMRKIILLSLVFLFFQLTVTAQLKNQCLYMNLATSTSFGYTSSSLAYSNNFSDQDTTIEKTKDGAAYLKKSKTMRAIGIAKLSIGTVLLGAGVIIINRSESGFGIDTKGLTISFIGLILDISCISSFNKAIKYKEKATLMMTSQSTGKGLPASIYQKGIYSGSIPGVSLIVPLGK